MADASARVERRAVCSVRTLLSRCVRTLLLAVVAGCTLVVVLAVSPADDTAASLVRACGIVGGPTMLANTEPALRYPITKNIPINTPTGIFGEYYGAGQPVAFAEDLSQVPNPPPAASLQWRWSFGDGTGYAKAISPAHSFAHAGDYDVVAQIYDTSSAAWTDLDSAQITVVAALVANPPVAQVAASASAIAVGGSITFDASASRSHDGSPLTYLWNFGDASTAQGIRVTHQFGILGKGFVALIVSDARGARALARVNVLIVPQLPVAHLAAGTTSAHVGTAIAFDASQSVAPTDPPGDQLVGYSWNFGDSTAPQSTTQPQASHTFQTPGAYTVAVTAKDNQGATATAKMALTVLAASAPTSASPAGRPIWLLLGGGLAAVALAVAMGYAVTRQQRRRLALIRQRERAQELLRARRVGARPVGAARTPDSTRRPYPPDARAFGSEHDSRAGRMAPRDGRGEPPPGRGEGRGPRRP